MAEETGIDFPGFPMRLLDFTGQCAKINVLGYKYESVRAGAHHK